MNSEELRTGFTRTHYIYATNIICSEATLNFALITLNFTLKHKTLSVIWDRVFVIMLSEAVISIAQGIPLYHLSMKYPHFQTYQGNE